jgi:hypothetical protein
MAGLKIDVKSLVNHFEQMLSRARLVDGWLNRVAYREILKVQKRRWETEGSSEGVPWAPVTSLAYKTYKLKKFRDYPGAGRKSLIATGRLAYSMTQDKALANDQVRASDHGKLVAGNRLVVESFVPYGKYQEEQGRDLTTLSDDTIKRLAEGLRDYIMKGTLGKIIK